MDHLLFTEDDTSICQDLINQGADVNYVNRNGYTPLLDVVRRNKIEKCKVLINNGADVNLTKTSTNLTPLMWSIHSRNKEIFKLLLDSGADPVRKGGAKKKDAISQPLFYACKTRDVYFFKLLIEHNAHLDTRITGVLEYAVHYGCGFDVCKLIIENGAELKYTVDDEIGTILSYAVMKGDLKFCKFVIEKGADVNPQYWHNPFREACFRGRDDICRFLIKKGAKIRKSALKAAIDGNRFHICKLLVDHGVDTSMIDTYDKIDPYYASIRGIKIEKITELCKKVKEYEKSLPQKRANEMCKKIKEELMKHVWNPEKPLGKWLVMNEFNEEFKMPN